MQGGIWSLEKNLKIVMVGSVVDAWVRNLLMKVQWLFLEVFLLPICHQQRWHLK